MGVVVDEFRTGGGIEQHPLGEGLGHVLGGVGGRVVVGDVLGGAVAIVDVGLLLRIVVAIGHVRVEGFAPQAQVRPRLGARLPTVVHVAELVLGAWSQRRGAELQQVGVLVDHRAGQLLELHRAADVDGQVPLVVIGRAVLEGSVGAVRGVLVDADEQVDLRAPGGGKQRSEAAPRLLGQGGDWRVVVGNQLVAVDAVLLDDGDGVVVDLPGGQLPWGARRDEGFLRLGGRRAIGRSLVDRPPT